MTGPAHYREPGLVHALVARTLAALELPADFIRPGDRVVLKPNWVKEHDERRPGPDAWEHVVTHPAVIEAVTRWAAERLEGRGSITICDAPQTDSSFATLRAYCGLDELVNRCRRDFPGLEIALLDLRPEEWHAIDGVTVSTTALPGDPLGSTHVHLDTASEFVGYPGCGRLYGASFDLAETNARHTGTRHEYLLCRTPMEADVFINLPKLKTHKKVGLTCALKNLVGINGHKDYLPHFRFGSPKDGGDEYPDGNALWDLYWKAVHANWDIDAGPMKKFYQSCAFACGQVLRRVARVPRSAFELGGGSWHGNDTL